MGYKEDLEINEMALDQEWIKQPGLYLKYSIEAAEADFDRKKAKQNLEVIQAETDADVRAEAKKKGEKITEKVVESRVLQDETYTEARDLVVQSDHNYNILMAAVRSFEQKKSALENLVKLHIAGYFSEPVQERVDEEMDMTASAQKKQRDALNSKRKKRKKIGDKDND